MDFGQYAEEELFETVGFLEPFTAFAIQNDQTSNQFVFGFVASVPERGKNGVEIEA